MADNPTAGEAAFKHLLLTLKIEVEFQTQVRMAGYIVDFYHVGIRLDGGRCQPFVVEIDGSSHVGPKAQAYDKARTAVINRLGIRVLRFTNKEVVASRASVAKAIMEARNGG